MAQSRLEGRTAIVTGAGAGLGRAEALALAEAGARIVVNDLGPGADDVVDVIRGRGGEAIAVTGDIRDWSLGTTLVDAAVDTFGSLDVVVNNAGITRDQMVFNLTEESWDQVIDVHLKGHASLCRSATALWRSVSKSTGAPVGARIVNTASEAFLFGSAGQPNYAAAKAGIVALTLATSQGASRYGVSANAICPRARTAMTADVFAQDDTGELDILAPERVATFVSYLASPAAAHINGQVFVVYGDMVALLAPATVEHKVVAASGVFSVDELAEQWTPYFTDRQAGQTFSARSIGELDTTGMQLS